MSVWVRGGLLPTCGAPQDHGLSLGDRGGCVQLPPLFFTSASLRIPGSNTTIEEKLEKYTSAVQVPKPSAQPQDGAGMGGKRERGPGAGGKAEGDWASPKKKKTALMGMMKAISCR